MNHNQIAIYEDSGFKILVKIENNSLWLSQKEMAELFNKDSDTIGLHLKNIYKSKELDKSSTTEEYSVVRKEGNRNVKRSIKYYNLDAIISVGYRVNSKQGTLFRIWATKVLNAHLVQGFTQNETRLKELSQSFSLISSSINSEDVNNSETVGIMKVLSDYALGLEILDGYDHQNLEIKEIEEIVSYRISYKEAKIAIDELKNKFGGSELFGNEKDDSFKSSISTIDQTFDGEDLYKSIEEKAANLLYYIVKNHSFSDGNKRIAAWIFVWYLNKNNYLYNPNGIKKIENNALASLTLMIALSKPQEKELMIKVVINSINKLNK